MRDRMIEKLDKSFAEQYEKRGLLTAQHTADDLLANGVIVPPCKVGDIVYLIGAFTGQIIETKVVNIVHNKSGIYLCLENFTTASIDQQFGKTIFLTKEEAKKALATDTNVGGRKERVGND